MATYTDHLNLIKPDGTDTVNIDELNGNMDVLDEEIGGAPIINNNWTCKKHADRTFEAWRTVTVNVPVQTAAGAIYVSSQYDITMPSFAQTIDACLADCNGSQQVTMANFNLPTAKWMMLSATALAATQRIIKFYCRGTY